MAHPSPPNPIGSHHAHGHNHNSYPQNQHQNQNPNHVIQPQHNNILHPVPNLSHPTHPPSSSHHKHTNDDDEEAIAKKKKNADAQAAFRQRRQTYIKSLEDTVAELKSAVTEMEVIVKTTSHEIKIQRQQIDYLETKLQAYESGELKPHGGDPSFDHHCRCCKFAPPNPDPRPPSPSNTFPAKSLPTPSTSAVTITTPADCPTPAGPSLATPVVTPQEGANREWPGRTNVGTTFQALVHNNPSAHHPPTQDSADAPTSAKSSDYPRNILHHDPQHQQDPNSSIHRQSTYPRPTNCDLVLFGSFGTAESAQMNNFYPSVEGGHPPTQPPGHGSSSPTVASSLEIGSHPAHLHSIMSQPYSRSPPTLGSSYPPLGHAQSFDGHHSGTLSSPRLWSTHHHNPPSAYPGSEPSSAHALGNSPKHSLYQIDNSGTEAGPSGFRVHQGLSERSLLRPTDYLPSLDLRCGLQGYSMIPNLSSPTGEGPIGGTRKRTSSGASKRRREWGDDKFGAAQDTNEAEESLNPRVGGVTKLNGLPAKVARCEQAVLEVSKVLSQAKEEVKAVTTMGSSTPSNLTHHSLPQNPTSNGFQPMSNQHHQVKFRRMKLNGNPQQQMTPSAVFGSPSQPSPQDQQTSSDQRYGSLLGS